jgi:Uma2 family endonuclease
MAGRDQVRAANPAAVKLTYDDFVLFPDDGKRHELIDGEHYVTPSPNTKHQTVAGTLHGLIWTRVGVSAYWVVEPAIDVIRIYRQENERFGRPLELSCEAGDVLTTPLLPGLGLPLARVFRE